MSWHGVETLTTPIGDMFGLVNVGHIFFNCGFTQHVEAFEDALVGEVQLAVTVVTVLLDGLLLRTLLGNVS